MSRIITWDKLHWLQVGDFTLNMGFEVTNLNCLDARHRHAGFSLLVNIYSKGYMKGDERIHVFFGYIALFSFSMLGLVISENMLELYIFWELVGVCSFLLVGFWYFKPEAKAAAKKAFIVTRIGDVGLVYRDPAAVSGTCQGMRLISHPYIMPSQRAKSTRRSSHGLRF